MTFGGLAVDSFSSWLRLVAIFLGIVLAALGGFASKASALKIKPFDNSYKKARESYKNSEEENESTQDK